MHEGARTQPGGVSAHAASFRDPSGFVFTRDGVLYRQINEVARADYERLFASGLYKSLTESRDMVSHQEVDARLSPDGRALHVIQPERIEFISYPYEWCFSQLKDAALLTLRLQKAATRHGMSLKDATPYNVAFSKGRPVWIDTLSFEVETPGAPWVAYRQFCEMFLAPLALMSQVDVRLQQLLRPYIDGVPLELASTLLPTATRLRPGLLMHIHLHAAAQRRAGLRPAAAAPRRQLSRNALTGIIDSLQRTVSRLEWRPPGTTWGNYYAATNYSDAAFAHKREIVERAVDQLGPSSVWDLGANDGTFSRIASDRDISTIAFDVDPVAVEKNYRRVKEASERHMLPLLLDLTHPSGRYGWANEERESLTDRGPADLMLALALVHHLAIAHNVPVARIAEYMARLARALVIEFVPKEDSQVQRMLASRKDIFDGYTQKGFEEAFSTRFEILHATRVHDSARTIYVMRRKSPGTVEIGG